VSPGKTLCLGNPPHVQPVSDSSRVQVTSSISSSGFSCKRARVSSPLRPIFCLAESGQHEGLARPPSAAAPNPGSPFPRCDGRRALVRSSSRSRAPLPGMPRRGAPSPAARVCQEGSGAAG